MRTARLGGLDALRGIAALIVLVYHVVAVFGLTSFYEINAVERGYLAVDFFFMLSGYVIARMLDDRPHRPVRFLWSRYRRFVPVMAVGTLIGACVHLVQPVAQINLWVALPAGLALVPILSSALAFPLNSPTWSIFFELFANAVHAVVSRKIWPVILVGAVVGVYLAGGFAAGPHSSTFIGGFARVLLAYSLGVILFQWWRDKPPMVIPPIAGAALFMVLMPVTGAWFDYYFVLVICPLVLASGLGSAPAWAKFAGELSFPLYAVHYPILILVASLGGHWSVGMGAALTCAVVVVEVGKRLRRKPGRPGHLGSFTPQVPV